jgi:putative CocE/NonD family hydrolase
MRDGARLFTAIYMPKDTSDLHPFLITRTPYSCAPYGEDQYSGRIINARHLLREGFIFVYQDVRGQYMSEGVFADIRPHNPEKKTNTDVDESSDTYDTVDWLLANIPNNNGKAGIYGISYPGFYSTAALPGAHPAVRAVSPQAPVTDWFAGDDFHHNGAFMLMDAFNFYYSFGRPRPEPTTKGNPGFKHASQDNYQFFLQTGALRHFTEQHMSGVPFWNEVMAHPNLDDFWKARIITKHLQNVKPATLVVGGLFDAEDCYGAWATYQAIEQQNPGANNRIVMGPWSHGGWSRSTGNRLGNISFGQNTSQFYREEVELPFFRYHLKGKGPMEEPEALVFATGANAWRRYPEWPPASAKKQSLYFQPEGALQFEKPTQKASFFECVSDPGRPVPYTEDVHLRRTSEYMTDDQRFASRRPDVAVFQTPPLERDIAVAGPVLAELFVSTTGTDADYVVKIIDVFPDDTPQDKDAKVPLQGYQMLVRGEIMRGRFRNSFEYPEPFIPGKTARVEFTLPDICHVFQKGHRIMVQVQYSWFPLADRNPQQFVDIYQCQDSDFIKATQRIFFDADRPSRVVLNVE